MVDRTLETSLHELTDIQRRAVNWGKGSLLVLAGPGSGKTRVLTCRVARLLNASRDQRFRILALTFTNKAAHEMASRVTLLAPGLEGRAYIDTFHGFCSQVLRQHGVHLGLKPNFTIYSRRSDRQAVLEDAISLDSQRFDRDDRQLLPLIDRLKAKLIRPQHAEQRIAEWKGTSPEDAKRVATAYRLYEEELRRANAMDFNSLIFDAYKLFRHPTMARHYQTVYRYWLIDEFQDTNAAQYALLKRMAGQNFREIFAVADDDQTIYEWNGANVSRIFTLVKDFSCEVVQLPTNFRCPPRIVEAANRLLVYNVRRVKTKQLTESAQPNRFAGDEPIQYRVFATDSEEVTEIAEEIADLEIAVRRHTAVLARTRALLTSMRDALERQGVPCAMLMRRDDFASPEMRWLVACLRQITRPLDLRNLATLVNTFGSITSSPLDFDEMVSRAAAESITYLSLWTDAAQRAELPSPLTKVIGVVAELAAGTVKMKPAIQQILSQFESEDSNIDLQEDLNAWRRLSREISASHGFTTLDRFLQELELRSKEPAPEPGAVSLATIHGSKGLEFDTVYLIGLAEEILPSWHSVQKGSGSAALEEERRGCFVAITRTKRRLVLSRARQYKSWSKSPSRFLKEMGFLNGGPHRASELEIQI